MAQPITGRPQPSSDSLLNVPVEQMTYFDQVLKSRFTSHYMLRMNPDYDVKFALACLWLINESTADKKYSVSACTPQSLVSGLMRCAELNLYPIGGDGNLSKCGMYFIPYWNKHTVFEGKKGAYVARVQPSWRALVMTALEGDWAVDIYGGVVREDCQFEFEDGLDRKLKHIPGPGKGPIEGAWAVVIGKDGLKRIEYLNIDRIMKRAQVGGKKDDDSTSPVWIQWDEEMVYKTIMSFTCGHIPETPKLRRVIERMDKPMDESNLLTSQDASAPVQVMPVEDMSNTVDAMPNQQQQDKVPAHEEGGEKEKPPETETAPKEDQADAPKRRRGRPAGSKNKAKDPAEPKQSVPAKAPPASGPATGTGDGNGGAELIEEEVPVTFGVDGQSADMSNFSPIAVELHKRVLNWMNRDAKPDKLRRLLKDQIAEVQANDPEAYAVIDQIIG